MITDFTSVVSLCVIGIVILALVVWLESKRGEHCTILGDVK